MNSLSLIEALENCTDSCGWCVHHCSDEDKYEMLVLCIRIQNEFLIVDRIVNKILSNRSEVSMKKIFRLFEAIASYLLVNHSLENKSNFSEAGKKEESLKLPGCSQIFKISQSLGQMYSKEFLNEYN
jgi:hypothetical protein